MQIVKFFNNAWPVLLIALIIVVTFPNIQNAQNTLPCPDEFSTIDNWEITDSNIASELLWQQRIGLSDNPAYSTQALFDLSANEDSIVFLHTSISCNQRFIVSVDSSNGNGEWLYSAPLLRRAYPVGDDYIVTTISSIARIDSAGQELWTQNSREVDFRSFGTLYHDGERAFFPAADRLYEFDLESGEFQHQQLPTYALAYWADFTLNETANHSLQLRANRAPFISVSYTIALEQAWLNNKPSGRYRPPYILRSDDLLLLVFEDVGVMAYDFETGEKLWEYHNRIASMPVVANDIIVYFDSDDALNLMDAYSGERLGYIELNHTSTAECGESQFDRMRLAVGENAIFIHDTCTSEILALYFEPDTIHSTH